MVYDSSLGTNLRAHLLNIGIEKVNNLKYYSLTDSSRIRIMAKHIKDLKLVMGIEISDIDSMKIATLIYKQNEGLSYKKFPCIDRPIKIEDMVDDGKFDNIVNVFDIKVKVIAEDDFCEVEKSFTAQLKYNGYLEQTPSYDIRQVFHFFSKRPYNENIFVKLVEESLKYLYNTDQAIVKLSKG